MLSAQHYVPWAPDGVTLPHRDTVEIVSVVWSQEGDGDLLISVASASSLSVNLEIRFRLIKAFQCVDEGYRWAEIPTADSLIYTVENSRYLPYFRLGAATIMDSFPLRHWIVVSRNQCVDVLVDSEAKVLVRGV
jgi:hypothetical protein